MFKYFRNFWFSLFVLGCSLKNENFVEGKIQRERVIGLNTSTVEKFTNSFPEKRLSFFNAQEVTKLGDQSIIKAQNEFFFISGIRGENFDMKKIFLNLKDYNSTSVKSFFYLHEKLFACIFDNGTLKINECKIVQDDAQDSTDILPPMSIELSDKSFIFNPHDKTFLNEDFLIKMKNSIQRRVNKELGKDFSLSAIDYPNTEISFLELVVCCSDCVIRDNKIVDEGCFIFVPCNVKIKIDSAEETLKMNFGLFFNGKNIIPCLEEMSGNSFYNGTFSDLDVLSIKSCGNKIACNCSEKPDSQNKPKLPNDIIVLGELSFNSEGDICYKLISRHVVENLKSFTFFNTDGGAVLTTIYIDNQSNKVKFGKLIESKFTSQSADLVGIDLYEAKSKILNRTRLRNYNMVFVGDNDILLQYKNPNEDDKSLDYLLTLNHLKIPVVS